MPNPLVDELPEHEKQRLARVFARLRATLDRGVRVPVDAVLVSEVRRWWDQGR